MPMPNHEIRMKAKDGPGVEESCITISTFNSIENKLCALSADSSYLYTACFFRVSKQQRKANEAAYTPRLVSIGPLHHGQGQLQGMDAYKLKCLQNFLNRFGVHLKDLVKFATEKESWVRKCYMDDIALEPHRFSEMILLDGIFIVEILLKQNSPQLRETSDTIFESSWMWKDLLHDMLLIENQLPLLFIQNLFSFVNPTFLNKLTVHNLAHNLFQHVGNTRNLPLTEKCYRARHFVELLLYLHGPIGPRKSQPSDHATNFQHTRKATELKKAGVKFGIAEGSCLFEVSFEESGDLKVPRLTVNDFTETFFRNLIALEQCTAYTKDITSYVILMDCLIDTAEDVALLKSKDIIKNDLGEDSVVADLFNNLYQEVVKEPSGFYFAETFQQLNEYSRNPYHMLRANCYQWKLMLDRDYCSTPCTTISFFAAVVLLSLTIIQTVCSILQVKQGSKDGAPPTPPKSL